MKCKLIFSSKLPCHPGIEFLTLIIYLYARFLSRRCFGGNASKEARSVFAFLLLGDIFAELAFVNVELYSGRFWVLVFLDFFMCVQQSCIGRLIYDIF